MENKLNPKGVLSMFLRWKWHLLIITIIAGILGAVFSMPYFIVPKFKSSATFYPVNIKTLSDESETEQMLEYLSSNDIKFKVIDAFNLYSHYGIDKENNRHHVYDILEAYNGNVAIKKTSNEAVVITVTDEFPQVASDMADSILVYLNEHILYMQTSKEREFAELYKKEREKKINEIDSIAVCLKNYRVKYGLLENNAQVEKYTEAINNGKNVNEAREVLGNWKEYGAEYYKLDSLFRYALSSYNITNTLYEEYARDMNKHITYTNVVSKPYPADRKAYPVRWIIVLMSMICAFVASSIIIAFIDGNKTGNN